jgi:hypothetical protein
VLKSFPEEEVMKKSIAALVLILLLQACMVKETRHTLYLDPAGRVNWTVEENDVRSTAADPVERDREEAGFLASIAAGEHPAGQALKSLAPTRVESRLLRDARPFAVRTEAEFDSVATLAQSVLDHLGIAGQASLRFADGLATLTVTCHPAMQGEGDDAGKEILSALADSHSAYRFVLTGGRFVEARNFRIEDGRVAVPEEPASAEIEAGTVVYSLTWTTADTPGEANREEASGQIG